MAVIGLAAGAGNALADTSTVSPVLERSPDNVTADALPTVQIDNGVVWAQAVIGNTVYAGGEFSNVRPAGAAAGTNLTPRANLVAFDIQTGTLNTSFAPSLNGTVRTVVASPDGSRIYVGGSFTSANGVNRYRIAAFNSANGQLITSFAPVLDATVTSITVTADAVYAGGSFSSANGVSRSRLAAFDPSTGALLGWAPTADATVNAVLATPDSSRIIVGGSFEHINNASAYGLAALDPINGTLYPWAANQVVQDAGDSAAILSLSTDGKAVYSTAYVYGVGGNFEGVMSADPDSGTINWLADCHGDTYGAFGTNNIVYVVSHQHYCANIGGFPDTNPRNVWHHATAFTAYATGNVLPNGESGGGYGDFRGQPSPSLISWLPDLAVGTYTGQSQAAWSVTGNSKYVVLGGEFPSVNNVKQYGLVRFAVPSAAPKKEGPRLSGSGIPTSLVARSSTSVRVSWQTDWDRDDQNLTYDVQRDGTIIYTTTATSQPWNMPTIGMIDTGLSGGTTYNYRIRVTDQDGNRTYGNYISVTTPTGNAAPDSTYATDVLHAGATNYWRLDQAAGNSVNYDYAGFNDLSLGSGVSGDTSGAIDGDPDFSSTFSGSSSGLGVTSAPTTGPDTFTISAWFSTTSRRGGKIIGFGNVSSGTSSSYDRHIYLTNSGSIVFGVYNDRTYTITSSSGYNDGNWHQVVGTLSSVGMVLYVDGKRAGTNTGTTVGQPYSGYWRVGGDNLSGWPSTPSSQYFSGKIDEVAVYSKALALGDVQQQYQDSGRSLNIAAPPTDSYGKAVYADSPDLYWRLDDLSKPTAADASPNNIPGVYSGGVTFKASSTVTGSNGTGVTFDGSSGTIGSSIQYLNPTTYSEEAWFKTTTTRGGKIIGFADTQSGLSNNYDRHVYMINSGQLVFGVYPGTAVTIQSSGSYNDGDWHQVVATQGPGGMRLYVDGLLVGSGDQTQAQSYSGYWRVGGGSDWGGDSPFFAGTIDEVAIYPYVLADAQVLAHYKASPAAVNRAPNGAFTTNCRNLSCSFDASGSSDPDGTINSYAWTYGDDTTGTGASPSHSYADGGTFTVTLTVTDNGGMSSSVSYDVTVTAAPNQPPTAAFTSDCANLDCTFDASNSSDPDGSIEDYHWDFGDGTTGSGVDTSHTFDGGGTHDVVLTVTDNDGSSDDVTHQVSITPANVPPTAAFVSSINEGTASFDASESVDSDGSITSFAWDFGDHTSGNGVTATHTYAASGDYTVKLTVTDDRAGVNSVTHTVHIDIPNTAPTATFASAVSGATVSVDASGSSDPDGTIANYRWEFGDGTTGTGRTTTHTYSDGGTYTVTLTVTDNDGATDDAASSVTVNDVVAADAFGRSVSAGWGNADVGGAWTRVGGSGNFSVDGTQGLMTVPNTSTSPFAMLNAVAAQNVNMSVDVGLDKAPTGTGTYAVLYARTVGDSGYRLKVRFLADGTVHLAWVRVLAGKGTTVTEVVVKGLTYTVGERLHVRFTIVSNADGTTTLTGSTWKVGATEPATPALRASDTEPSLRVAGAVGMQSVLGSGATTAPVTVSYDNLSVQQG